MNTLVSIEYNERSICQHSEKFCFASKDKDNAATRLDVLFVTCLGESHMSITHIHSVSKSLKKSHFTTKVILKEFSNTLQSMFVSSVGISFSFWRLT